MPHFPVATVIACLPALVPLAGLAGAWLQSRYGGRKVRLKIGPEGVEVEGQTVKQLREILDLADDYQRKHQKALIHEP